MRIPTEPIGSIPRPLWLIDAIAANDITGTDTSSGMADVRGDTVAKVETPALSDIYRAAICDTEAAFEKTGSPVITDGEQRKYHNFWTYCVHGSPNTSPDGFRIPFEAGHIRRMPRLTTGPFRYMRYADEYLDEAKAHTSLPVKQAVISPSALSLMYPDQGIADYPREQFIDDLLAEHEKEVRQCLAKGAHCVQVDITEGPTGHEDRPFGRLVEQFH